MPRSWRPRREAVDWVLLAYVLIVIAAVVVTVLLLFVTGV